MNSLRGNIYEIRQNGNLSLVTIKLSADLFLKTIIVETPQSASYLTIGHPINVLFKETEVVMGTNMEHQISLQNKIPAVIKDLEKGSLLSRVIVESSVGSIESIISTNALDSLKLTKGMKVMAMIKLNEIMLGE